MPALHIFADGDSGSHFNCTEKAIIDFKLYKSVKFFFFFLFFFSAVSVAQAAFNVREFLENLTNFIQHYSTIPIILM